MSGSWKPERSSLEDVRSIKGLAPSAEDDAGVGYSVVPPALTEEGQLLKRDKAAQRSLEHSAERRLQAFLGCDDGSEEQLSGRSRPYALKEYVVAEQEQAAKEERRDAPNRFHARHAEREKDCDVKEDGEEHVADIVDDQGSEASPLASSLQARWLFDIGNLSHGRTIKIRFQCHLFTVLVGSRLLPVRCSTFTAISMLK